MGKEQCAANPSEMPPNFVQVVLPAQTMHMEGDLLPAGENILCRCKFSFAAPISGWSSLSIHTNG
jgi:hypothetical protein